MSSISRTRSGYQRLADNDNFESLESGVPAPFPTHELYPTYYPMNPPQVITPPLLTTHSAPALTNRTFTVHAPLSSPPMVTQATIASFAASFDEKSSATSSTSLIPTTYLDPRTASANAKLERNLQHEKLMVKILHCIDRGESIDFVKGLQFEKDIPEPSVNLLWLGLATMRPDVINLLCRLHSPFIEKFGEFVFAQIVFDISKGFNKKLDRYPAFLLEISKQNPDKIPPHFLLKYYLCSKEKFFKERKTHEYILRSLIKAYSLTPDKILELLDQKQLNEINSAAASMMQISSADIVTAKKRSTVVFT